jgi:hypothetical protein
MLRPYRYRLMRIGKGVNQLYKFCTLNFCLVPRLSLGMLIREALPLVLGLRQSLRFVISRQSLETRVEPGNEGEKYSDLRLLEEVADLAPPLDSNFEFLTFR